MTDHDAKSGKRIVLIMLGLVLAAAAAAWLGAMVLEDESREAQLRGAADSGADAVVSEGVLYEAQAGDPGVVVAKDVGSGVELWRAEVGTVASPPSLSVQEKVVEVQIAGTPWMTLDRSTGEPVD